MLSVATLRNKLAAIKTASDKPFNVNFFCHTPPLVNAECESVWRKILARCYRQLGLSGSAILASSPRVPFSDDTADRLEKFLARGRAFSFRPAVSRAAGASARPGRENPVIGHNSRTSCLAGAARGGCNHHARFRGRRASRHVPHAGSRFANRYVRIVAADRECDEYSSYRRRRHRRCKRRCRSAAARRRWRASRRGLYALPRRCYQCRASRCIDERHRTIYRADQYFYRPPRARHHPSPDARSRCHQHKRGGVPARCNRHRAVARQRRESGPRRFLTALVRPEYEPLSRDFYGRTYSRTGTRFVVANRIMQSIRSAV